MLLEQTIEPVNTGEKKKLQKTHVKTQFSRKKFPHWEIIYAASGNLARQFKLSQLEVGLNY